MISRQLADVEPTPASRPPYLSNTIRCIGGLLATLAMILIAGALFASPAQAHAVLLASNPGDGEVLATAPTEVLLQFNEAVELPNDPLQVMAADGDRVDNADAGHGPERSTMQVSLPSELPDGAYIVSWRAISADTHPVRGSLVFTVGQTGAADVAAIAAPQDTQRGWELAAHAGRWLTYAGTLLAAGGAVFLIAVYRRVAGGGNGTERVWMHRLIGSSIVVALVGTIANVPIQAALTYGAAADPAALASLLSSTYGASVLLRLAGLTVLFIGVAGLWTVSWAVPTVLAGAAGAVGSFLLAGHTVTAEPRDLIWLANFSHAAAAAVWLGGLALLAIVLTTRRRVGAEAVGGAKMVARFSTLAVGSVLLVAAGGIVLTWSETRSWSALLTTTYGQLVLAKVALMAVLVAIGAYNNRWLVPAIVRADGDSAAWRRLGKTVRWEAGGLLIGVLVITAILVSTVPGRVASDVAAVERGPYNAVHEVSADYQLELTVDPAYIGTNEISITLQDHAGAPADVADQVEFRFSLPEAEIENITRQPQPDSAAGGYRHSGPELAIGGDWEIEIRVLISDFERHSVTATVPVSGQQLAEHHH